MHYVGLVSKEGRHYLVEFPDAPGCQTFAESKAKLAAMAEDALLGWLEAHLVTGEVPPLVHKKRLSKRKNTIVVPVPPLLAVKIELRRARLARRITQAELARRMGVSQSVVTDLENPDHNSTLDSLSRAATALHAELDVRIETL